MELEKFLLRPVLPQSIVVCQVAKHLPLSGNPEFVMGHRGGGRGRGGGMGRVSCHADLASEAQRVLKYCINERFIAILLLLTD